MDWAVDGAAQPAGWLRYRNREASRDAKRRVRLARVVETLALTAAAWADGSITTGHVEVISRVAGRAKAPEAFAEYEPVLLEVARSCSPEETYAAAVQWLAALDDFLDRDGAELVVVPESVREAYLSVTTDDVGVLNAVFDADGAAVVHRAIDRAYDVLHRANDDRSAAQQRADALVEICSRYLEGMPASGNRPHVQFVVDLDVYDGYVIGRGATDDGIRISTATIQRQVCNGEFSVLTTKGSSVS
jgi:hypothetical protein